MLEEHEKPIFKIIKACVDTLEEELKKNKPNIKLVEIMLNMIDNYTIYFRNTRCKIEVR